MASWAEARIKGGSGPSVKVALRRHAVPTLTSVVLCRPAGRTDELAVVGVPSPVAVANLVVVGLRLRPTDRTLLLRAVDLIAYGYQPGA
jgi:hypothetical protein